MDDRTLQLRRRDELEWQRADGVGGKTRTNGVWHRLVALPRVLLIHTTNEYTEYVLGEVCLWARITQELLGNNTARRHTICVFK